MYIKNIPNNWEYKMQEKGFYKNYYLSYPATLYNNGAVGLHKFNKLEYYYYFVPVRFKY